MPDNARQQAPRMTSRRRRGFTLVELMVVIAVLAILLGIAVPSFQDAALGMRLGSYANNLVGSVYLARGEAIKRNATVTLCASGDGSTCAASGSWEQGWIVMCRTSDNSTCNAAGGNTIVMQSQPKLSTGLKATGLATGTSNTVLSLSFPSSGVGVAPAQITVCRATPTAGSTERVVNINSSGRPSVSKTYAGSCS